MESDDDDTIEYEIEVAGSSSSTCSLVSESPIETDLGEESATRKSEDNFETDQQPVELKCGSAGELEVRELDELAQVEVEQIEQKLDDKEEESEKPNEEFLEIIEESSYDETDEAEREVELAACDETVESPQEPVNDAPIQAQIDTDEAKLEPNEINHSGELFEEVPLVRTSETNEDKQDSDDNSTSNVSEQVCSPQTNLVPRQFELEVETETGELDEIVIDATESSVVTFEPELLQPTRDLYRVEELIAETEKVENYKPIDLELAKRIERVSLVAPAQEILLEIENDELYSKNDLISGEEQQQVWLEQIPDILKPHIVDLVEEDLESEFDNEPPFEARDVSLKRNCDPRSEYELGDELGKGRFGTVYRCVEQTSGRKLAAKFIHMRRREDREDVEREVEIMRILQHKRLLQLYDAFDDGHNEMCLITELVEGGELFERIVNDDFELTEKKAAIFMRQICEGVEYMHSKRIVHLDMKPENILCLTKRGNRIKLIDFGLARQLKAEEALKVMFGTPDFAAPEVLAYDYISLATDMWSVGVICYVLLSGLSPFMGDNDMDTMANVTRAAYDFDDEAFEPISDLAKDFISKLLVRDQAARLKPAACLQHPWLRRGGHELEASVRSRRGSAAVISSGELEVTLSQSTGSLPSLVSLDKRNLKKYVVRRKWHKTVHAIMALGRMGANLKLKKFS